MWHENGLKESELTYKDGRRDGKETVWFIFKKIRNKRYETTYKDGKEISSKCWDVIGGDECECNEWGTSCK